MSCRHGLRDHRGVGRLALGNCPRRGLDTGRARHLELAYGSPLQFAPEYSYPLVEGG